ncbi:uncharacterized protein LOC141617601 isoform X1 [Silene latifolia]|uniref:uncharacterized protein LOC141617601 isoform X1 n=2 Tax=Silene latifolia TaxID=37657 RepID=UPI003D7708C3
MRVAVIGGGISGLGATYELAKAGINVVLYEKEERLGGHAKTVCFDGVHLDLGFMVFNRVTYPNMLEMFENLGIEMEASDMSFSVSLDKGRGCEWGSRNGLRGLFAQKTNALNPYFLKMIQEIIKFKDDAITYLEELENNPDMDRDETLGNFINSRGYSELFQKAYLVPMCASIWSCPSNTVMNFSAYSILSFCRNHHLLQLFGRPQWLTVKGRSHCYVNKVREELEARDVQVKTSTEVHSVSTTNQGCTLFCADGTQDVYDRCIIAVHAPDAIRILGKDATFDETRLLGAFQYVYSDIYLHRDKTFMPRNEAAWSAWNFLGSIDSKVCLTYWLNVLQNICQTNEDPFLVTLNPPHLPENVLLKWITGHPVPSVAATKASLELDKIQGTRGIWFCGAYQGYGFHEDGLKAGMSAAHSLLGSSFNLLKNPKQMVPSLKETAARLFVTRFLSGFISAGSLTLLEDGGTILAFEGSRKLCPLKVALRVHNPQFYWKVATEADLGLADAYINGDFSFVDKNEGLLNLFMIFISNRDLNSSSSLNSKRGWWTPMLITAGIASAKYFYHHVSRQNTLTQARRNISRHYDLSNDMFSLFLDETMTYSCAIFESASEDLSVAQMRKISLLIEKARVEKHHEVLEIGCGWGSLAIEVVKRTGCKYTGITLSEEQLKFAERRVKEAGLQDRIRFLLIDYRQLPDNHKYDRIISCEMLEAVGHEFMEEFFRCCESLLAANGLLVLQFISIPDERYDEYRRSSDFIKEYIFPGGCLPCLSRVTSAMTAGSRLCVEHLENIGIHYYQTLRYWRKNFLDHQSKICSLGFDDKFIRTWEYYFDYCAAGFKTRTLGNYQIVFSRPGNVAAFSDS